MRRELGPFGTPLFGARTDRAAKFGWDAAVLQFLLLGHGISVPVNGYVDGPTVRGLRRYQRQLHLTADGVVGRATYTALGLIRRIPVRASVSTTKVTTVQHYVVVRPVTRSTVIAHRTTRRCACSRGSTVATRRGIHHRDEALRPPVMVAHVQRTSAVRRRTRRARCRSTTGPRATGVDPQLARALAWMESALPERRGRFRRCRRASCSSCSSMWKYVENVLLGHSVPHTASGNVEVGVTSTTCSARSTGTSGSPSPPGTRASGGAQRRGLPGDAGPSSPMWRLSRPGCK